MSWQKAIETTGDSSNAPAPLGIAHADGIWSAVWSSKNQLVTGSLDNTVKVWYVLENNWTTGAGTELLGGLCPGSVCHPTDQWILLSARNADNGELAGTLTGHHLGVNSVDTNVEGTRKSSDEQPARS